MLSNKPHPGLWEQDGDCPVDSLELKRGTFLVQGEPG